MATRTDRELAHVLTEVQGGVTRRLAVALRGQGCSPEEWWVLNAISETGGRPMNEIAEFAMLPKPSLTKLVDGMVGQNLVYRRGEGRCRGRGGRTHGTARSGGGGRPSRDPRPPREFPALTAGSA